MTEPALCDPSPAPDQTPPEVRFEQVEILSHGDGDAFTAYNLFVQDEWTATLLHRHGERWVWDTATAGYLRLYGWWTISSVGAGATIDQMTSVVFRNAADAADAAYRIRVAHPELSLDEFGLTPIERRMIDLEAGRVPGWETYPTADHERRLMAVLELFDGMRELRYGQKLNRLMFTPGAWRYDPNTVKRLRALHAARRAARSSTSVA